VGERLLILFIGFLDVLFADAQVEEGTDVAQFGPSQPRTDLQRTGGGQAQAGSLTVIPDGRGYAEHSAQHRENVRRSCDMPFGRNRAHPPPHIARGAERTPPHPQIALLSESGTSGSLRTNSCCPAIFVHTEGPETGRSLRVAGFSCGHHGARTPVGASCKCALCLLVLRPAPGARSPLSAVPTPALHGLTG
jgi:hypothetical protein